MAMVRLQKVLARAGVASRRAAEELITEGRVRVDGRVVTELGTKVDARASRIEVDGQRVVAEAPVYIVLNKPRGYVSTMSDPEGRPTVRDLLHEVPARVFPVGRLDFNTSGVLLATNDGDFADGLMHPKRAVPKTYVVKVQGVMQPKDLDRWRSGVVLEDGKTQPAKAKLLRYEGDKTWLSLTITEGRNQQVRRMGDATGFRVMRLARVEFAGVTTEGMRPGAWRYLVGDELTAIKKEYGVPKRIVHPPLPATRPTARDGARRTTREAGDRPRRTPGKAGEAPRQTTGPAGEGARQTTRQTSPRYGGGSPARRDLGVREDWGGGIRRGASGREGQEDEVPREDLGRGRTRTTGSGGGIGARGGSREDERSYRVRGRGGPRR
jgi:23S rRNA pseudouridine2605 synthase